MKRPEQVWLLWHRAKTLGVRPSEFLALEPDSYEAYCLDEAVVHFGTALEHELEQAGHKPSKEERRAKAARETILERIFGDDKGKNSGFADPASMFK